jgi:CelD/BcsL family acetyltransferase involved in cellulose biosynthesis
MSIVKPDLEPGDSAVRTPPAIDGWVEYLQPLQFMLGGYCLAEVNVPGVTLDISFTKLTTNIADTLPPWDEFSSDVRVAVVSGQPIEKDLPALVFQTSSIRYVTVNENRYYIDLGGTFAAYLEKFSSKSRANLRKSVRKFTEFCGGQIRFREFQSATEMAEFFQFASEVSRKTYQERIGQGLPRSDTFRERAVSLANADAVRGYILFHGERPVAYIFCDAQDESLIYEHLGYDPAFREWSPGRVLLYLMLERLFAEQRFRFLDFGGTEHEYKKFFSTGSMRCARIHYFRRTWRNLLLVLSHSLVIRISRVGGELLELLRLKDSVKNLSHLLEVKHRARQ